MCSVCEAAEERRIGAGRLERNGAVAQLVERLRGTQEVGSSSLLSSTLRDIGFTLGGLVAAEGCFTSKRRGTYADGSERRSYLFEMAMATRDRPLLEALQSFFGRGSVYDRAARKVGWQ